MTQICDEIRERGGIIVEAGQGVGKKNLPPMGYFGVLLLASCPQLTLQTLPSKFKLSFVIPIHFQ